MVDIFVWAEFDFLNHSAHINDRNRSNSLEKRFPHLWRVYNEVEKINSRDVARVEDLDLKKSQNRDRRDRKGVLEREVVIKGEYREEKMNNLSPNARLYNRMRLGQPMQFPKWEVKSPFY